MSTLAPLAEYFESRRGDSQVLTLAGTTSFVTGVAGANQVKLTSSTLVIDPDGAKTVVLPVPGETLKGLELLIVNTAGGAEAITVESPAGTTLLTVTQAESGVARCAGAGGTFAWYNVGVGKAT